MPAIVPFFCAGLFGEEVTDDMSVQLPPSITKFQKEHDGFNRQASQHDVGAGRPLKKPTTSSDANAASSWVHELQVLCMGRPRPRPRRPVASGNSSRRTARAIAKSSAVMGTFFYVSELVTDTNRAAISPPAPPQIRPSQRPLVP